jgi:ATP-dependent exoDNAse (exonuclease V) beta subunit
MIEQNHNIHNNKQINRIVEYSEDSKQINLLDQRFYRRNGKYYPSVTSILSYFPKGKFFENWLKDVGWSSEQIAKRAADEGTQTHTAIENFLKGNKINWLDDKGNANYSLDVWKMILKFADFWNTHKPELIHSEYHVFSDEYEYAGTIDLICKFQDKIWIWDIKTSNSLHTSYEMQLAAYAKAWNETHDIKIDDIGIIWLKSMKRGPDKKGKVIQGDGWELKIYDRTYDESFNLFINVYNLYKLENPVAEPYSEQYPLSVELIS